jgi:hypothetical protein
MFWAAGHFHETRGQVFDVATLELPAGFVVPDHLGYTADACSNHGLSKREALENAYRSVFVPL